MFFKVSSLDGLASARLRDLLGKPIDRPQANKYEALALGPIVSLNKQTLQNSDTWENERNYFPALFPSRGEKTLLSLIHVGCGPMTCLANGM